MVRGKGTRQWLPWLWLLAWFGSAAFAAIASDAGFVLARTLAPPGPEHWLGCDAFGRDLLSLTLRASALSALFAGAALAVTAAVALAGGLALAVAPAAIGFAGNRALDFLLAFPSLLLALAWAAARGPGWDTLAFALLVGSVPSLTRLMNVRGRELLAEDFVESARAIGATPARIAFRHLLPGVVPVLGVKAPATFAGCLMAEATLSFLGVGAPIGRDTWGSLLSQAKDYLIEAPHLTIGAGLPLFFTVLALQEISESIGRRSL